MKMILLRRIYAGLLICHNQILVKYKTENVIPKIETLQKIAAATHTKLVISFESKEGEE